MVNINHVTKGLNKELRKENFRQKKIWNFSLYFKQKIIYFLKITVDLKMKIISEAKNSAVTTETFL